MENTASSKNEGAEEQKPAVQSKQKSGGCLRNCFVILVIFLVLIGVSGIWGRKFLESKLGTSGLPTVPTITIESGTAEKQEGNSWQAITTGTTLSSQDTIKTLTQSEATVAFSNGSELRLDENTRVTLNEVNTSHISIFQHLGRTWSRVEGLLGKSQYEVETPTAVATVRGTTFSTDVALNEDTTVDTGENTVQVDAIEKVANERKSLHSLSLEEGFSTIINKQDLNDLRTGKKKLAKERIKDERRNGAWFKRNRLKDEKLKERFKNRRSNLRELLGELPHLLQIPPQDIMQIRSLIGRLRNGNLQLNDSQKTQLDKIGVRIKSKDEGSLQNEITSMRAEDIAQALAIIDPGNFSDTAHWINTINKILPLIQKSGILKRLMQE